MIALISVFPSIPLSVFIGGPIIVLLIKASVIPFESTLKYKLFGAFFLLVYFAVFYRMLRSETRL